MLTRELRLQQTGTQLPIDDSAPLAEPNRLYAGLAGKMGREIAAELGISEPSLWRILRQGRKKR